MTGTIATLPAPVVPNAMAVRSQSGVAIPNLALSFARYFHPGQIPSGSVPQAVFAGKPMITQSSVMSAHGDGSVKHALIDFIAPEVGLTDSEITFQPQASSAAGSGVTASSLLNDARWNFGARIVIEGDAQAFTTESGEQIANARTMLTAGDVFTHRSGPICTEFIIGDLSGAAHAFGVDSTDALTPIFQVKVWPHINAVWIRYLIFGGHTENFQHQDLGKLELFARNTGEIMVYDHETALVNSGYVFPPPFPSEMPDATTMMRIRWGTYRAWSTWAQNQPETMYRLNQGPAYLRDARLTNLVIDAWTDSYFDSGAAPGWTDWEAATPTKRGWMGAPYELKTAMETAGDNYNLGMMPGWSVPAICSGDHRARKMMTDALEAMGQWTGFGLIERDVTRTLSRANGGTHDGTLPPTAASRPAFHGGSPWNTSAGADLPTQIEGTNLVLTAASEENDPIARAQGSFADLRWQTQITHWPNSPTWEWLITGDWLALWALRASYSAAVLYTNGASETGIRGRGPDNTVGFAGLNESPRALAWEIGHRSLSAFLSPDDAFGAEMRATVRDLAATLDGYLEYDPSYTGQFGADALQDVADWSAANHWLITAGSDVARGLPGEPLPDPPPYHSPMHFAEFGDTTAHSAVATSPGGESDYAALEFFRSAQIGTQSWMNALLGAAAWNAYRLGFTEFLPFCRFAVETPILYFRHPDMRTPGQRDGRMLYFTHRVAVGGFAADINADPWRWFTVREVRDWMTEVNYVEPTTGQSQVTLFQNAAAGNYLDNNVAYVYYNLSLVSAFQEMASLGLYAGASKPKSPYMAALADDSDGAINALRLFDEFVTDIATQDARIGSNAPRFSSSYAPQFETEPLSFSSLREPEDVAVSSIGDTGSTLSWSAPSSGTEPDQYRVQISTSGGSFSDVGVILGTTTDLTGLSAGTDYTVRVRSETENQASVSGWVSRTFTTTGGDLQPPANVTVGSVMTTTAILSWAIPSGSPPEEYRVGVKTVAAETWTDLGTTTGTSSLLTSLTAGTEYMARVRSESGSGSEASDYVVVQFATQASSASLAVELDVGGMSFALGIT